MNIADSLHRLAARIPDQKAVLTTEEATKNALVMPFINALGFNVFDPHEVVPEFTVDVGTKKGEKVDYVIMIADNPMVLIECKTCGSKLDLKHASQLFRYFSATDARFAVLTNGIDYQFYTDLDAPNRMDERPFFDFSMSELTDAAIAEINKFTKAQFDLENILGNATELKYTKQISRELRKLYEEPDDEFTKLLAGRVYSGNMIASVREQFRNLVQKAFRDFVRDEVKSRLRVALANNDVVIEDEVAEEEVVDEDGIDTTEDELQAYYIVRAVLSKSVSPSRIAIRDTKSYCGVLLDDNNRKPICRLHFNGGQKYIGVFDASKNQTRHAIESLDEIHKYETDLLAIVDAYDDKAQESKSDDDLAEVSQTPDASEQTSD